MAAWYGGGAQGGDDIEDRAAADEAALFTQSVGISGPVAADVRCSSEPTAMIIYGKPPMRSVAKPAAKRFCGRICGRTIRVRRQIAKSVMKVWWARLDSNQEPDRYERSALTIELQARCARHGTIHYTRRVTEKSAARSPLTTAISASVARYEAIFWRCRRGSSPCPRRKAARSPSTPRPAGS